MYAITSVERINAIIDPLIFAAKIEADKDNRDAEARKNAATVIAILTLTCNVGGCEQQHKLRYRGYQWWWW